MITVARIQSIAFVVVDVVVVVVVGVFYLTSVVAWRCSIAVRRPWINRAKCYPSVLSTELLQGNFVQSTFSR